MKQHLLFQSKIQFLLLIAIVAFSACEKIDLGEPFECKIGEKYRVNGTLSFSIDSIRDYRCDYCIWSGDVDLYFNIKHNFARIDTLIYFLRERNPFNLYGHTWKIEKVDPHLQLKHILPRQITE